jgi:hypothetical protein
VVATIWDQSIRINISVNKKVCVLDDKVDLIIELHVKLGSKLQSHIPNKRVIKYRQPDIV